MNNNIRKILSLLLLATTVFGLTSCQSISQETLPTQTTPTVTLAESEEEKGPRLPTVPDPLTWDDIHAIPIAHDGMTEDERRQIVVDFFRLQQSFQWTPNEDLTYLIVNSSKMNSFPVGRICQGLPYVSNARGNLYILMDYYDPETGVLDVKSVGANNLANIIGNQCSYGSFWGWARVSNTYRATLTKTIVAKNGAIPVGPYTYDTSIDKWSEAYSTRSICQANGEQIMYQSYAQMKPGDGMVFCNLDKGGHVQMVSGAPVVVRKNGEIDGDESFLLYIDQDSSQIKLTLPDGTEVYRQADVDTKLTFSQMYKTGYVPFTVSELQGDTIERATATFFPSEDTETLSGLLQSKMQSNYAVSHLVLTFFKEDGTETRSYRHIPSMPGTMEISLADAFKETVLKHSVKDGTTLRLWCYLGTGEQFTLLEGPIRL